MKNLQKLMILLGLVFWVSACTQAPKSDEAEVGEAKEKTEAENATKVALDMSDSKVTWVGTKPIGRHYGTFAISKGELEMKDGKIVGGMIEMDLNDIAILDEDIDDDSRKKLTTHLKSDDFFHVEKHPKAVFEVTAVEKYEGKAEDMDNVDSEHKISNPTHKISGNLTIRGKKMGISFPARVDMESGTVVAKAKFNIDRTQWGVSHQDESDAIAKGKDKFIHNKVNVGFEIKAKA